jgi:hypothetical protein
MARIIVNATMIRFPMGGMNLWILTWLVGMKRLGHEVYLIENSGWEDACFDYSRGIMTDDCSYGISVVRPLLARYGLENNWCFIDHAGNYHGLPRARVDELFRTADAFIDFEWGDFFDRAAGIPLRIFMDGEPGWFQVKLLRDLEAGKKPRDYDHFYTPGLSVGTEASSAPTAGIQWRYVRNPVLLDDDPPDPSSHSGRFTTIMNWQSNKPVEFQGKTYGQKDIEFEKFMDLPRRITGEIEVAASGGSVPGERLARNGWIVSKANEVARSLDSYREYIAGSKGEFSVAKNAFVQTQSGWIGDREGVYMSYGKPVVLQETGFALHLPCGLGLFSVRNVEEAAEAISEINSDYLRHSRAAREIALEYLSTEKAVGGFLTEIGLQ